MDGIVTILLVSCVSMVAGVKLTHMRPTLKILQSFNPKNHGSDKISNTMPHCPLLSVTLKTQLNNAAGLAGLFGFHNELHVVGDGIVYILERGLGAAGFAFNGLGYVRAAFVVC